MKKLLTILFLLAIIGCGKNPTAPETETPPTTKFTVDHCATRVITWTLSGGERAVAFDVSVFLRKYDRTITNETGLVVVYLNNTRSLLWLPDSGAVCSYQPSTEYQLKEWSFYASTQGPQLLASDSLATPDSIIATITYGASTEKFKIVRGGYTHTAMTIP